MSPRGWPKGKPRGPYSKERAGKAAASLVRVRKRTIRRQASLAAGHEVGGEGYKFNRVQNTAIDISPAAFRSTFTHVGDCEYLDDGLDERLMRALSNGVVYAGSPYAHHEPLFQDITIDLLAAVEKTARKYKIRKRRWPGTPLKVVETRKLVPRPKPLVRAGTPLTAVVTEMFSTGSGKPLVEVVSEMFDS